MSERDDRRGLTPIWLTMAYFIMLLALIAILGISTSSELRDLQRRVSELEQAKR